MSWFESVSLKTTTTDWPKSAFGAEQATLAQVGAMSPLWMLFVGASAMGMAYWSMTHWMRLATPGRAPGPAVKLRLVKPEPAAVTVEPVIPEAAPVPEAVKAVAPVIPVIEPAPRVEAEAAPKAQAAPKPEPVAEAAPPKSARAAPALAPKPAAAKARLARAAAKPAAKVEAAPPPKAKPAAKTPRAKKS